jgi:hypothetical protein
MFAVMSDGWPDAEMDGSPMVKKIPSHGQIAENFL